MKVFLVIASCLFFSFAHGMDVSGELSQEARYFLEEGAFGNVDQSELSLVFRGELSHSWDDDRKVISVIPFFRLTDPDQERTHLDIREASFVGAWSFFEVRAGISKVYWGVTESQHLVDVINQTDLVENIDGEDKLGQPMINPTLITDYGNFSYFLLPYFRERTFAGANGRFRTALVFDTDNPIYTTDSEERHIDHAFRYSHYVGSFEFGVSYFNGIDREPIFNVSGSTIRPMYVLSEQVGLDAQYIIGSWAFKFEGIWRDRETKDPFYATTAGLEYTFSNVHKGLDVGVLVEYLTDDRGINSQAFFRDHIFSGGRFSFNDELGTEFLIGGTFNNEEGEFQSFRLEASRRINNNWKWELEMNSIFNTKPTQIIHNFKNDDYIQLGMQYFF